MVIGVAACGMALASIPWRILGASPSAEVAWSEVLRLDAGPQVGGGASVGGAAGPRTREAEAAHLVAQEKALRIFLELPGGEARGFEAKFRLARVLSLRAEVEGKVELQVQAEALLEALDLRASPEQKAHIAFTRVVRLMRKNRLPNQEQRVELLTAARDFRTRFPTDPRAGRLLVEVATQFDRDPGVKRSVLQEAERIVKEPQLVMRIRDDLRKVDLVGKRLEMRLPVLGEGGVQFEKLRGRPVVLFYFSENSTPSLVAWDVLNEGLKSHPEVQRIGVSLDKDRAALERVRKSHGEGWILSWDGLGWESPSARQCGINALPTAWLVDSLGRLMSLNVLEDLAGQLARVEGGVPQ